MLTSKIPVTASFYPLYDFAKNVGGDKVSVANVTPAGSEPHDFDPSPKQLVDVQKSKIFIYNGTTMEPWVKKFLPDYKNVAVKASQGIDLQPGSDEDGKPLPGITDPHFWLDPVLAQKITDNIKDGFIQADPGNKNLYTANAEAHKTKLKKLDQDFALGLLNCQTRSIVTAHAAFGYLAKRYNLDVASIAGVSPDEEPSAAKLAELTKLVKDKKIKYIFFETLVSPKLADTIAHETGAKTLVFDPIEGLSETDQQHGKDYISVQRENLQNLRLALACQ